MRDVVPLVSYASKIDVLEMSILQLWLLGEEVDKRRCFKKETS